MRNNNIVLFGDSHLARPLLTQQLLDEFSDLNITNHAKGGWNTENGIQHMTDMQLTQNDIIILSFGSNDAAPWKQISLDRFGQNYRNILMHFSNCRVISITPPPVNDHKQQPPGRSNATTKQYAQVIEQLSAEHSCLCVDLFTLLTEAMPTTDIHAEDGVHLNVIGYSILTMNLIDTMKKF